MLDAVNNRTKQRGRPFKAGASGNPHGRPKGARNKRTRAMIEAAQPDVRRDLFHAASATGSL
jgi:hypothetical protein